MSVLDKYKGNIPKVEQAKTFKGNGSFGEIASGALSQGVSAIKDIGKAVGTLAMAPVGFLQASTGSVLGKKEWVEQGIERATAPVKGIASLGKAVAYDLPKQLGTGMGKVVYGGTVAPFQRGLKEALKYEKEGLGDVASAIGTGLAFVPTPMAQVGSAILTQGSEFLKGEKTAGESLGEMTGQTAVQTSVLKLLSKLNEPRVQKAPTTRAKISGLADDDIEAITDMAKVDKNFGKSILEAGIKTKMSKRFTNIRPMELVGKEFIKSSDKLDDYIRNTGKQIGEIKNVIKGQGMGKLSINHTRNNIFSRFAQDGVKVKIGSKLYNFTDDAFDKIAKAKNASLYFDDSTMALNSADKSLASFVFDKIKKGVTNVDEAPNLVTALQNKIYSSKGEIVGGKAYAELLRKGIKENINQFADDFGMPQLKSLSEAYHEGITLQETLKGLIGEEGVKSPIVLRRAFSNTGINVKDVLGKMDDYNLRYNIGLDKNLFEKASFAETVESALKIPAQTGIEALAQAGAEATRGGGFIQRGREFLAQQTVGRIVGSPQVNISRLLERPTNIILPSRLDQIMSSIRKIKKPVSQNARVAIPSAQNQGAQGIVGESRMVGLTGAGTEIYKGIDYAVKRAGDKFIVVNKQGLQQAVFNNTDDAIKAVKVFDSTEARGLGLPEENLKPSFKQAGQSAIKTDKTGLFNEYDPSKRYKGSYTENTPLTEFGYSQSDDIIIYRGVPKGIKKINDGDWVTTNKQLAKDYAGTGDVISMKVKAKNLFAEKGDDALEELVYSTKN